jgi:hypothetical protein
MNSNEMSLIIQREPLCFVFERDDGRSMATPNIPLPVAISMTIDLLEAPIVSKAIPLPRFMQRWLIRILQRSYRQARLAPFKQAE